MIYPLLYGVLPALMPAWPLKKLTLSNSPALWLALLPLVGMLFDYLENFRIAGMLDSFPDLDPETVPLWNV